VPTFFRFLRWPQVINHHLSQFIGNAGIGAIAEPVRVNVQGDRRISVTKVMLQIRNRDAALDQDRGATMAQAGNVTDRSFARLNAG
jgi:hypothetical protein